MERTRSCGGACSTLSLSLSLLFLQHVIVEQEFGAQGCGPPGKGGPSEIGAVLSKIVHDVHTHPLAQDPLLKRGFEAAHQLHWIYVGESIHAVVYIV